MLRSLSAGKLWIGNAMDARNLQQLHEYEIRAVVDLAAEELPAQLSRDLIYLRIPLHDGGENAADSLSLAILSVVALLERNISTLVACSAGMSRSPTIALVASALVQQQTPQDLLTTTSLPQPLDISPALWTSATIAWQQLMSARIN